MSHRPTLSVLIPVYNEAPTVQRAIERVEAVDLELEILVADDGSTDGTAEILARMAAARDGDRFGVVTHPRNRGKGAAIRSLIPRARGKITIIQDADLEYDPGDYPALIRPLLAGESNVVYGSRRLNKDNDYPFDIFLLGSMTVTAAANLLYRARITDEPTCYKVFRTELLQSLPLRCEGFEFCPEVTARVRKRGERIVEVPISYVKRSVAEGKKINWRDGVIALWTLVKYRLED